ncbi:hypothetical protein [Streptomyces sp. NPDC058572]|uniref:hypothetical protein n=1 Tax=Streptomyces sp. NPDC058572 TaxID=3346546 RepID=UPI003661736E
MNVKTVLARSLPVAAMVLASGALTTSPAAALDWDWGPYYSSGRGAKVYFEEHGDQFKVCDIKTDGYRAVVWVTTSSNRYLMDFSDSKNDGRCSYSKASDGSFYNLPENTWIEITACVTNGNGCQLPGTTYNIYND